MHLERISRYSKIGYKDESGTIVIEPIFDEGPLLVELSENNGDSYASVLKDRKCGVINQSGIIIVPFEYEEAYHLFDNLFAVRKQTDDESWVFGVINSKGTMVIPFIYKLIIQKYPFILCYENAYSKRKHSDCYMDTNGHIYEYDLQESDEIWYRANGVKVFSGKGKVLSDSLLAVALNDKWGVINQENERIVNFLYDSIEIIQGKIIVANNKKIGVLDNNGSIIINPSYNKIECVITDNTADIDVFRGRHRVHDKEYVFDTEKNKSDLPEIGMSPYGKPCISIYHEQKFNFNNLFILTNDDYCEVFSVENGIIANSRFDLIRRLTDTCFAVRENEKWGVMVVMTSKSTAMLQMSCEYDRIVLEDNEIVLLCKRDLWGAKSICYPLETTDIPIVYKEIKVLNTNPLLFCVKRDKDSYGDDIEEEYTIIDEHGKVFGRMDEFYGLESQFTFYNMNRILTKKNNKFGFISVDGYVSIPFKYDEIVEIRDGLFHVNINFETKNELSESITKTAWGVLDLTGKEIVNVKYDEPPIPVNWYNGETNLSNWSNLKVKDALTEKYGILAEDGTEKVPAIFDHLTIGEDYIYFGYGGYVNDDNIIKDAIWGCMDQTGKIIINAEYAEFEVRYGGIFASRNNGLYDLFDFDGELIFGGFDEFEDCISFYLFHFGDSQITVCDKFGDYSYYYGQWLAVDKNNKSILRDETGEQFQFEKGFIGTIESEKIESEEDDEIIITIESCNIPKELLSIKRPKVHGALMVCGDGTTETAVVILDGSKSNVHDEIVVIKKYCFFFIDEYDMKSRVGVAEMRYDEESHMFVEKALIDPITENTEILTYPIGKYVFGVSILKDNTCTIKLYDLQDCYKKPIIAISSIEYSKLADMIVNGNLLISIDSTAEGLKQIMMPRLDVFDDSFKSLISEKELDAVCPKKDYWFTSGEHIFEEDEYENKYDDRYTDEPDYMRDSWDAMTDGMYGDMPDGFDGDYDFLGY